MSFPLVFPKSNRTPSDGSPHLTQGHLFSDVSDEDRSNRLKHLNAIDPTLPGDSEKSPDGKTHIHPHESCWLAPNSWISWVGLR